MALLSILQSVRRVCPARLFPVALLGLVFCLPLLATAKVAPTQSVSSGVADAPPSAAEAAEQAAEAQADTAKTKVPEGVTILKSFADMGLGTGPLRLDGWQSTYVLKLPLSPREVLNRASLKLVTVNSTALIRSRSALTVRLNGTVLKQYPLDPMSPEQTHDIDLPLHLLKAGYNDVAFDVVQHYTYDCEDPASPELWTEINPHHSALSLTFSGVQPELAPRLSQLHIAFDRRGWIPRPLAVVSGTEQFTEGQASAAALVVQGLALRMGYRPLDVEVYGASTAAAPRPEPSRLPGLSSTVVKGRDVLIVGRRAEISRYLTEETYVQLGKGPFVGIFSADRGEAMVLVVSGETDEDLYTAARALADPNFRFSDSPADIVTGRFAFERPAVAVPGVATAFSNFDFRTSGVRGSKISRIPMHFRAPADYGARHGDLAELRLHFSYGAGLRQDSSLILRLNGEFAVAVPLNEPSGAEFQAYSVKLPAQFIRPGDNELSFESVFATHKDRCESARDEGLVLTIYEDSTLKLPHPTVLPVAPDLERFARSYWPYDDKLTVHLTERDTATVAASLTLLGQMAQRTRAPFDAQLTYMLPETGHVLMVGSDKHLPDYLATKLPLHQRSWSAINAHANLSQTVQDQRVVTALLAQDPFILTRALRVLHDRGYWNGLSGAAAIVNVQDESMVTEPATSMVSFGAINELSIALGNWKRLVGLAFVLSILFALALIRLLRRQAKAREQVSDDEFMNDDGH